MLGRAGRSASSPALGALAALVAVAACGSGGTDPGPAPPARVALAGVDSALVGDAGTLAATVTDADGRTTTRYPVAFASSDTLVARVDGAGRVTTVGAGLATLTARVERSGGTPVTATALVVVFAPAAELRVLPGRVDLAPGAVTPLGVLALDAEGRPTSVPVTVTASAPNVARASGDTAVLGVAPGEGTVTVFAGLRGRGATATVPVGVTAVGDGGFPLELRFVGSVPAEYAEPFARAAAFWRRVITAPLAPAALDLPADLCDDGLPALAATTAGVVIDVRVDSIDGAGRVLGAAGPCVLRASGAAGSAGGSLPSYGVMRFDSADVGNLVRSGRAVDVIRHEMGHVLGIGTLWNARGRALRTGTGTVDVAYVGAGGVEASATLGFTLAGAPVPVENTGGGGTANGHWRESVFTAELMTGFLGTASANPASRLTVRALADLGYAVNLAAAEPLLPAWARGTRAAAPVLSGPGGRPLVDVPLAPRYAAGADGRPRRLP